MRRKLLKCAIGVCLVFSAFSVCSITAYADDLMDVVDEVDASDTENVAAETADDTITEEITIASEETIIVDKTTENNQGDSTASSEDTEITEVSEPLKNGWEKTEQYWIPDTWRYFVDGECLIGGPYTINSKKYIFSDDGHMIINKLCLGDDQVLYSVDSNGVAIPVSVTNGWYNNSCYIVNGKAVLGWKKIGNYWYYFDQDTAYFVTGPKDIDGKKYFFDGMGHMKTGWVRTDMDYSWAWAGSDGSFVKGWRTIGDNTYYFNDDYEMLTGLVDIDGLYYNFASNGKLFGKVTTKNGWVLSGNVWYYFDGNGTPATGLKTIGTKQYYLYSDGSMSTNALIDNRYFGSNGAMVKNTWIELDIGKWSYFDENGLQVVGWKKINEKWYYFDEVYNYDMNTNIGDMATGDRIIDGRKYHFLASGAWDGKAGVKLNSWYKVNGRWHYCNADGTDLTGLQKIGSDTYYFDSDGVMLYQVILDVDGEARVFDKNGKMIQSGWYKLYDFYVYVQNGKALSGMQTIGGKKYYFSSYGTMHSGCNIVSEDRKEAYEIASSGEVKKIYTASGNKWVRFSNGDYCYSKNGEFVVDKLEVINGETYRFSWDGLMETKTTDGMYGWYGASGKLEKINGWAFVDRYIGKWFYLNNGQAVCAQERIIDGKEYYFGIWGVLETGVVFCNGAYYYYNGASGGKTKMNFKEGWNSYNNKWYYMKNGKLVVGNIRINNNWYQFGNDYAMVCDQLTSVEYFMPGTGGYSLNMYLDANGKMVKNCWKKWAETWYYFGDDGKCVIGEQVINGKKYIFNEYGELIE